MFDQRKRHRVGQFIVGTLLILVVLAVYFGAYLGFSTLAEPGIIADGSEVRVFPYEWQVLVFQPANRFESAVRGKKILVGYIAHRK